MITDFDARSVAPKQGGTAHPPGMFPFTITNTYLQENKEKTGAMLVIEFSSDVGSIENRYNLFNNSPDAVRIAQEQLSALCHAVNIYQVPMPKNADGTPNMAMAGHTLRGGKGRMEIVPQMKDGQPNGYMKLNKVFDINGNEPGKTGSQPQPQQQGNNQPMQQNNAGGWSTQQPGPQQGNPNTQQNTGWANNQQPNTNQQANPQQQNNAGPTGAAGGPSWAR